MSIKIKDNLKSWKKLKEKIDDLKNVVIKVGIQSDAGINSEGVYVVDYAFYNEFGTDKIPARPFVTSTTDKKNYWRAETDQAFTNIIMHEADVNREINIIGIKARDDIKQTITDGVPPPNALSTIKKKGSSHTLIDTGLMRNSVQYKIERNNAL